MANLNLSQAGSQSKNIENVGFFDKSLILSLSIVVISVGSWLGLQAYASSIASKRAAVEGEISEKTQLLESDAVSRVLNFQARSEIIGEKLNAKKVSSSEMFASMERLIIPNVVLDEYSYDVDKKLLVLKASTSDFKNVSQQVMSLKSNDAFKKVSIGQAKKNDESGVISFEVQVSL